MASKKRLGEDERTCYEKLMRASLMPSVTETAGLCRPSTTLQGPEEESSLAVDAAEHDSRHRKDREPDCVFQEILTKVTLLHMRSSASLSEPTILAPCESALAAIVERWMCVRHLFRPAQRLKMDSIFTSDATMIRWALNRTEAALSSALLFVSQAEEWLFAHLPLLQKPVYFILQVLSETQNADILQRFLSLVKHRDGGSFLSSPWASLALS